MPDFIEMLGPLGIYDTRVGNAARLETIRWIQMHVPPGGAADLTSERVAEPIALHHAILYFLIFDPDAPWHRLILARRCR